jgi:hypothetical protein
MRNRSFVFLCALAFSLPVFGQYKMDPTGDPVPTEIAAASGATLQGPGIKVLNASGQVFCELWLAKAVPAGSPSTEPDVTLAIPVGGLVGAIKFPEKGADRRGQIIQPGVYLLRYVLMPVNGAHLGAAPQRDFAAMIPTAVDKGGSPSLEETIAMSTKASGTGHPAVLSLASGSGTAGFTKEGDHDWTLNGKIGNLAVAVILIGKAEN